MNSLKLRVWNDSTKAWEKSPLLFHFKDGAWCFESCAVIPDYNDRGYEIIQCTGIKDKNGKEIWEGDILDGEYCNFEVTHGAKYAVQMGVGGDSDGYSHGEWYGWKCGDSSLYDLCDYCEVLGNKFENPELLKREKKA